jgi:hypothetical protein
MRAVDEPVLVAVIGVGGVLVGAVGSGGIQAFLARGDRRREGRNAALALYMKLHEAETAIEELRPRRDWDDMITDWTSFEPVWAKNQGGLAHVLSTPDFVLVDSAFAAIASLSRSRERDNAKPPPILGQPPHFDPPDFVLERYGELAQGAKLIVLNAAFRWREKRRRREALAGD